MQPKNPDALVNAADAQISLGRPREAVTLYHWALQIDPTYRKAQVVFLALAADKALERAGLKVRPEYIVEGQHGDSGGYLAMLQLLKLNPPPDGVFCYNDPVAAGAIKAVLEAGLKVPEQIAITPQPLGDFHLVGVKISLPLNP